MTEPVRRSTPTLWQFRLSHYNEKVRWALDWKGIPHVRNSLVPGFHIVRTLRLTGKTEVPILELDGATLVDSTRIIETLEAKYPTPALYPSDPTERQRAVALEEFADVQLGPHIRRALFFFTLPDAAYSTELFALGESALTKTLFRAMFPGIRLVMGQSMGINAARAAQSREKTRAALDRIAAEIQPSGYLVGNAFSIADLTAAALMAPIVTPPEFAYPLPRPLPAAAEHWRDELATHPAFQWAERMFRVHRGQSAEITA